jgi:hypothetical protein
MKKILGLYLMLYPFFVLFSQVIQTELYKNGDFLFQDLDCGPLCDAIENATFHNKKYKISHVGVIVIEHDSIFVIEAYEKVQKTPLKKFLNRSKTIDNKPKVIHARLRSEFDSIISGSLQRLKTHLGKPYDHEFKLYNDKFYCSELLYETFLDGRGRPVFKIHPMTFKNKNTGKTDQAWIDYFKEQNIPIPEGEPGCNPADYLQDENIKILQFMY